MKKLMFALCATALVGLTGCVSEPKLVMSRTVPADKYQDEVEEIVRQIELKNRYETVDVQSEVIGDKIKITVVALEMPTTRALQRKCCKLQNENIQLKRRIADLEAQLPDKK